MWNPWIHVRTAGALTVIVGVIFSSSALNTIGLTVIFLGVVGGVARLERLVEAQITKDGE